MSTPAAHPTPTLIAAQYAVDTRGTAPCGATYGTAAGPNNGVTPCAVCGVVHPVQSTAARPALTEDGLALVRDAIAGSVHVASEAAEATDRVLKVLAAPVLAAGLAATGTTDEEILTRVLSEHLPVWPDGDNVECSGGDFGADWSPGHVAQQQAAALASSRLGTEPSYALSQIDCGWNGCTWQRRGTDRDAVGQAAWQHLREAHPELVAPGVLRAAPAVDDDEVLVEELAEWLATRDGQDWWRMDARTPDMRPWRGLRARYGDEARAVLATPALAARLGSMGGTDEAAVDRATAAWWATWEALAAGDDEPGPEVFRSAMTAALRAAVTR